MKAGSPWRRSSAMPQWFTGEEGTANNGRHRTTNSQVISTGLRLSVFTEVNGRIIAVDERPQHSGASSPFARSPAVFSCGRWCRSRSVDNNHALEHPQFQLHTTPFRAGKDYPAGPGSGRSAAARATEEQTDEGGSPAMKSSYLSCIHYQCSASPAC